jgi:hypothetical protein
MRRKKTKRKNTAIKDPQTNIWLQERMEFISVSINNYYEGMGLVRYYLC